MQSCWKPGHGFVRVRKGPPHPTHPHWKKHSPILESMVWHTGCRFYVSPFLCLQLGTFGQCSEKAMAPHSSTLAWKIPWMEEPGGLPSMGSHRVGHDWSDLAAAAATYNTVHGDPDRRNTHSPRPRTISRNGQLENGCCSGGQERNREAYVQADPLNPVRSIRQSLTLWHPAPTTHRDWLTTAPWPDAFPGGWRGAIKK